MIDLFLHFLAPACALLLVPLFFITLLAGCAAPAENRRPFGENLLRSFFFALKVGLPLAILLAGLGTWWLTSHVAAPDGRTGQSLQTRP
jgi:hypothetical protein